MADAEEREKEEAEEEDDDDEEEDGEEEDENYYWDKSQFKDDDNYLGEDVFRVEAIRRERRGAQACLKWEQGWRLRCVAPTVCLFCSRRRQTRQRGRDRVFHQVVLASETE